MAISISEERKSANWLSVSLVILVVGFVFAAAYYVFFKSPALVEVPSPDNLKVAGELSQVKFDPSSVTDSEEFKKLIGDYGQPAPANLGRANPFLPF